MLRLVAFAGTASFQLCLYALGQQIVTDHAHPISSDTLIPIGMAFVGGVSVMGLTWRSARTFQSINDRLKAMETFFEECSKRDDCPVKKRFRK